MAQNSRTPQDIIDRMVDANDAREYVLAIDVLDELFDGDELDDEVLFRIASDLLRRMHSDRDAGNVKLQERYIKVLNDLHTRCHTVIDAIEDFVENHPEPEDETVARFFYGLIWFGSLEIIGQDSVIVVLNAMIRHENDPIVQENAMRFIFQASGPGQAVDDEDLPFLRDEDLPLLRDAVMGATRNHPDSLNVQKAVCRVLSLLHCRYEFLGEGAVGDFIEPLLQAMQTHPTSKEVQGAALLSLNEMMDQIASLNYIIQGGGVNLVIRAMQVVEGGECLPAFHILTTFFGSSADARRTAIGLGAIPMLLDILRQDNDGCVNEDEREMPLCAAGACAALNTLFLENIDNVLSLQIANEEGTIELIVDKIGRFIEPVRLHFMKFYLLFGSYELEHGDILAHLAMLPANDGKLPLHYAAGLGKKINITGQTSVIEHLLKVYPEAATVRDGSGRLPLHIAIESRASVSVLELLLHVTPDAGEAVCRRHDDIMLNFPPVLMAAASDCDLECIFVLLRHAPSITRRPDTFISRKRKSPPA